jgi:hypothetical protein
MHASDVARIERRQHIHTKLLRGHVACPAVRCPLSPRMGSSSSPTSKCTFLGLRLSTGLRRGLRAQDEANSAVEHAPRAYKADMTATGVSFRGALISSLRVR